MSATRILRIIATKYDDYWHRQHFRGYDFGDRYCEVDGQIHTFTGEPECPISESVSIVEVDDLGHTIKVWQE